MAVWSCVVYKLELDFGIQFKSCIINMCICIHCGDEYFYPFGCSGVILKVERPYIAKASVGCKNPRFLFPSFRILAVIIFESSPAINLMVSDDH